MFYAGGKIIQNHYDEEAGEYTINPQDVITAIFVMFLGANQSGLAAAFGPDMAKASAAAERIFKVIDQPSRINATLIDSETSNIRIKDPEQIKGKIEFKNVWFRYPTRKQDFVLRGLTLTIEPEEKVALVGESGCGKSTFVNLLMRFYDVEKGEILLDGVNIKDYNLHDLRRAVSLVMQEPVIFNYSILENILYGDLQAKNSQVEEAAQVSNCTEFINSQQLESKEETAQALLTQMEVNKQALIQMIGDKKYEEELGILKKMKDQEDKRGEFLAINGNVDSRSASLLDTTLASGYETVCGVKGGKLSGGQKQRVAIARAVIRRPKILLLDEATSSLDEVNQQQVQSALNKAMSGRTTVVIAHRLTTIENCEKVFVLDNGRVQASGALQDVKQSSEYFQKIES